MHTKKKSAAAAAMNKVVKRVTYVKSEENNSSAPTIKTNILDIIPVHLRQRAEIILDKIWPLISVNEDFQLIQPGEETAGSSLPKLLIYYLTGKTENAPKNASYFRYILRSAGITEKQVAKPTTAESEDSNSDNDNNDRTKWKVMY